MNDTLTIVLLHINSFSNIWSNYRINTGSFCGSTVHQIMFPLLYLRDNRDDDDTDTDFISACKADSWEKTALTLVH